MTTIITQCCRECGDRLSTSREFCNGKCRSAFHNRRKQRGADLYDLVMSHRFEREDAKEQGAWSLLCRMASNFRQEDHEKRAGRKSWEPVAAVKRRHPQHGARRLVQVRR
jgi:hypothetical protein